MRRSSDARLVDQYMQTDAHDLLRAVTGISRRFDRHKTCREQRVDVTLYGAAIAPQARGDTRDRGWLCLDIMAGAVCAKASPTGQYDFNSPANPVSGRGPLHEGGNTA